jgi:hypothetical protein
MTDKSTGSNTLGASKMGQAKNRGTYEERKAAAIAKKQAEAWESVAAKNRQRNGGRAAVYATMAVLAAGFGGR